MGAAEGILTRTHPGPVSMSAHPESYPIPPFDGTTSPAWTISEPAPWEFAPAGEEGLTDAVRGTQILVVDDCTLQRENLAALLMISGVAEVNAAWDLPSLNEALRSGSPSLILLNVVTADSAVLLRAALEILPQIRVIVLGLSEDDEAGIVACAEAGAAGYHTRSESLDNLLDLMSKVNSGESVCSPRVSAILLRRLSALASRRSPVVEETTLTAREAEILTMLKLGLSNREIAEQLCIAVHTVKNHVHSLLTKLGVSTRGQAAALANTVQ